MIRKYALPLIVWVLYRLLSSTWRLRNIEPPEMLSYLNDHQPFIMAHWHGDEGVLLKLARRYRVATIVSTSKDGEMMNTLFHWMGGKTSRGSSTRGGVSALKGLIRLSRAGYNTSFSVDGPKGPVYKVKPGVFEMSKVMQAPIFAVGIACDRKWLFPKSWNQAYLPKPFAKIEVHWQKAFPAPIKENSAHSQFDPHDPNLALQLESTLNGLRNIAAKEFAAQ